MSNPDLQPVIVGTGQATWRDTDTTRTPMDALLTATKYAIADSDSRSLASAIDAIVNVRFIADTDPGVAALFPANAAASLAGRLGLPDAALYRGAIGGNSPQYLVNRIAEKLQHGEHSAVLLCGAELMATLFAALREGGDIGAWAEQTDVEATTLGKERDGLTATEMAHGLYEPINTYPLFENSLQHTLGRPRKQHDEYIAQLCARMSSVAADNPHAWRRDAQSAQAIAEVAPGNRYIGFPYTRAMNAILEVDMAAAVIMTTVGKARELGIPQEHWVYFRGGVDLDDIWYPINRMDWHSSPAINAGWQLLREAANIDLADMSHFDIYSCFPSAVEISCRELGLDPMDERGVTVTGGLPFFGGPGNNYSLHAIAEMAARLRAGGGNGLVTANGLYLTKHSMGVYSSTGSTDGAVLPDCKATQRRIDSGPQVDVASEPSGRATVETYTVAFNREGPARGIIVARNSSGDRLVANTEPAADVLHALTESSPIGLSGDVRVENGTNIITL